MISRLYRPLLLAGLLMTAVPALCNAQQASGQAVMMNAADLFNYDTNLPLAPELKDGKGTTDYKTFDVTYTSANNQRVPAVFVLPLQPPAGKLPVVVLMHGLGMNKTGLALMWGVFIKAGYAVFAIDAQYHGDRAPKSPLELFGRNAYSTRECIVQTVIDLRRAVDFLVSRPEIDPGKIGYAGFSMGGILGTVFCAVEPRIKAPILALAGGNWAIFNKESKHQHAENARKEAVGGVVDLQALAPVDPILWVMKISPRPVLFINGDADDIVPVNAGKALHAAAGPEKEVFIYKGGHTPGGTELFRTLGKMTQWLNTKVKDKG